MNQSTLVGNDTQGDAVIYYDGTLNLFNSIVAGRLQEQHILSIFNPTGVNLINVALLDLRLAPLGNYGGATQTMPPLPGSPAIDGCTNGTSFASDQRGLPRISGLFADIGAAELQIVTATNPPVVTGLTRPGNGSFQFSFANLAGASFTVFASTNLALPFNAWENLGPAVETPAASGQFQFTDPEATNKVLRFYRIRSP